MDIKMNEVNFIVLLDSLEIECPNCPVSNCSGGTFVCCAEVIYNDLKARGIIEEIL